ncbi:MAG TPA: FecR domain-containing protein [Steroidobacteraceae bacterium]
MNALEIERIAADWLVKRTSGAWNDEQEAEFEAWIDASLAHRIAYLRLETVWKDTGRLQALAPAAPPGAAPPRGVWFNTASLPIARSSSAHLEQPASASPRLWRRGPIAAVASLLLVLAVSVVGYVLWPEGEQFTTRVGVTDVVSLEDGSQITLNTDTGVRVALKPAERVIELHKGEAYFEVAKDPARPFIVNAGRIRVIAVGTKFSVRRDGSEVQVVVTEGAVRLEHQQLQDSQRAGAQMAGEAASAGLVVAGAIARAREGRVIVEQESERIEDYLSWRNGYLVFRDTPLADAVAEFNRYHDRKIVIEDPAIAAIQVGGTFRSTSTDVFLWMLRQGFPIEVDEQGRDIVLRAR